MITIPHPVNRKISTYSHLYALITNYHEHIESWRNKVLKEIELKAQELSEGDKEIEECIYSQESSGIYDQTEFEELLFNKSMLIMVYSYYESILHKMAIDVGLGKDDERPSLICQKMGAQLSTISREKTDFIWNKVHYLRNHLCHNDSVTKGDNDANTEKALIWLQQNKCIDMIRHQDDKLDGFEVYYISKEFILDVLNKEHDILVELSKVIGYKGYNC